MGVFHKDKPHKKHEYKSEDVVEDNKAERRSSFTKRGAPELVINEAPQRPPWGGKGVEDDTRYKFTRGGDGGDADGKADGAPAGALGSGVAGEGPAKGQATGAVAGHADGKPGANGKAGADAKAQANGKGKAPAAGAAGGGTSAAPSVPGFAPGEGVREIKSRPGPAQPPPVPARTGMLVHAIHLVQAAAVAYVVWLAVLIKWLRPGVLGMGLSLVMGIALGIGYSYLFHANKRRKQLLSDFLNLTPGRKGLREALGHVPSWIQFSDREKVEWLNRLVINMWPYYDKAAGQAIREAVEPILEQYKPPGLIKRIYFKTLTFGDAPLRIDNVWVEDEGEEHVLMEVAFRWAGDANIALAIELPAGGDHTRMVPKVNDIQVAGVARVSLTPLVTEIPGFGAAIISLRKPPLMHFNLDFGAAFGGSFSAKAVRMWLDPFIRETLTNMLVWPNRLVIPMLPESVTGPLDDLMLRNVGLLVLKVVEAEGLKKMDTFGKSDPFVEAYTQAHQMESTSVQKHTLTPHWDEDLYVMVQEPKTQNLRVQMFDRDLLNVKELVQLNVLKGMKDTLVSKELMGRASIPLRPLHDKPGEAVDAWYDLGKGEWSNEDGTGKGEGRLRLIATYWPFDLLYSKPREATMGAVMVTVVSAKDIAAADPGGLSDPYVTVKLNDEKHKTATKGNSKGKAEWGERFEWIKVPKEEVMEVSLWDADPLGNHQPLGMVEIDIIAEIVPCPQCHAYKIWYLDEVPKDRKTKKVPPTAITLHVQWVPFDFTL